MSAENSDFERFLWLRGVLATWRATRLLLYEDGPFDVLDRLRAEASKTETGDTLFSCHYCMSVWVGLSLAILRFVSPRFSYILETALSLSAGSILITKASDRLMKEQADG
jgi:hypothetical protein